MKKILFSIIGLISLFMVMPNVEAKNDVKLYIFTAESCDACHSALEYFNGLLEADPNLFDLVEFEVFDSNWAINNDDLYNFMKLTLEHFGEDTEKIYTPVIAIGDYLQVGTADLSNMRDRIIENRDAEEEVDTVKKLAKENNVDINALRKKETRNYDLIILLGILVVLIGGFAGFIIMGKRK